jgi:hypothetical protein
MSRRRIANGPALSRPIRWAVVPKPGGEIRRLVVLRPTDEVAFARSVAGAAPAIRRAMSTESHANRVVAWDKARGPILEQWKRARRRWRDEVRRLGSDAHWIAVTDVRACYSSISPIVMADRLRGLGAPPASVREIERWLHVFHEYGIDGLPAGPCSSALLADAVLSAGDDAIRATGARHVRWVDDVAIFAPDARTRAVALDALRRTWASLGLELHDGKTVLLDGPLGIAHLVTGSNSPTAVSPLR